MLDRRGRYRVQRDGLERRLSSEPVRVRSGHAVAIGTDPRADGTSVGAGSTASAIQDLGLGLSTVGSRRVVGCRLQWWHLDGQHQRRDARQLATSVGRALRPARFG